MGVFLLAHVVALMPRKATGNVYESAGRWYARVALGPGLRPSIPLTTCATEEHARARLAILAELARKLRAAGQVADARKILESAGARDGKDLAHVLAFVEALCESTFKAKTTTTISTVTVRELGKRWTSGELVCGYPDQVPTKTSAQHDVYRLERYIYLVVGALRVAELSLDDAELVMRGLPAGRAAATRRHVAQILHRLLSFAVFPLRLRAANPLPRGFLPKVGQGKAKSYLYPDEDARLLASPAVPLAWRIF